MAAQQRTPFVAPKWRRAVAHWEARLKREGLAPVRSLYAEGQGPRGTLVGFTRARSTVSGGTFADTATAAYWRRMTQAVADLPPNWKGRAFLVAWVECGYTARAAAAVRYDRAEARRVLNAFLRHIGERSRA
jgi:hypothetical protein